MRGRLPRTACAVTVRGAAMGCTTAPSVPETAAADPMALVVMPGGTAASSLRRGPFGQDDDRAFELTNDDLGAALAATRIASRISSGVGAAAVDQPVRTDLTPVAVFLRVIVGDSRGDHVVVSQLADTAGNILLGPTR